MVTTSSTVVVAKEHLSSQLDGEAVVLDVKSGTYFGLNTVGSSIWDIIQEPKKFSEIQETLLTTYEVAPEQCEQDLLTVLQEMADEGLIEVS